MNLVGDPNGLAALQRLKDENKTYLKFLLQEARTVFERRVDFKGADGVAYRLAWLPAEQQFSVSRVDAKDT